MIRRKRVPNVGSDMFVDLSKDGPLVSIAKGKPHPYLTPPPGGGTSLGLETGFLTFDIFLSPPVDVEVDTLAGLCQAYGLYTAPEFGGAIPIFVFVGSNPGCWAIRSALQASREEVDYWIKSDNNFCLFRLMETPSGIVRQLRRIGLQQDFLEEFKKRAGPARHPADMDGYSRLAAQMDDETMFGRSDKWMYDQASDRFVRTRR